MGAPILPGFRNLMRRSLDHLSYEDEQISSIQLGMCLVINSKQCKVMFMDLVHENILNITNKRRLIAEVYYKLIKQKFNKYCSKGGSSSESPSGKSRICILPVDWHCMMGAAQRIPP